jgi:hypothetical protein
MCYLLSTYHTANKVSNVVTGKISALLQNSIGHTIAIVLPHCSFTYQATANCVLPLHSYWSKLLYFVGCCHMRFFFLKKKVILKVMVMCCTDQITSHM